MAKTYSAQWFVAKGTEHGWSVTDHGENNNGHWIAFDRDGHPQLRMAWWHDLNGDWVFMTAALDGGVVVPAVGAAKKYLESPVETLEALKARQFDTTVWDLPPDRAARTGSVTCCGKSWVVHRGNRIAPCKKCLREIPVEEIS